MAYHVPNKYICRDGLEVRGVPLLNSTRKSQQSVFVDIAQLG